MKIAVFLSQNDFTQEQQDALSKVGEVTYITPPIEKPLEDLIQFAQGAEIIAIDPDNFGGFEGAKEKLTQLMEALPDLKGVALDTTSYGWIDLDYCKKRNIVVSNCPGWSREAVAEHAIALLFDLAKRIVELDRKTQKGEYKLSQGFELRGKTLGVIGVGNIGSRVAELGKGIGMRVIGYNHSPKKVDGVEMKESLDELLAEADAISLNVTHGGSNENFIGAEQLAKMKDGVIIVNFAVRDAVNENAMADAIKSGKVFGYAFEAEKFDGSPLLGFDNVVMLKPFAWYTKEALVNLYQVWVDSMIAIAEGKPKNRVDV